MQFEKSGNKLIAKSKRETIWIEPYSEDCLRFRSTLNKDIIEQNWTLLPQKEKACDIKITENIATIKNGRIKAEVLSNGTVNYIKDNGEKLLEELWIDYRVNNADLLHAREYKAVSSELYKIQLTFKSYENEKFYGMGQYANGQFNLKGSVLELAQKNTQISIPFLLSNRNYGLSWNNPAIGRAELVNNYTRWTAEGTKQIDYLIIYGETPEEIIKKYTNLYGKTPMLPEWAAGFWQCKLRYRTQEELLNVAREYKKRDLPLSVIVIDFFHWPMQGEWRFDEKYRPDPKAMVEELKDMGVKLMVSVWPTVDLRSQNFEEMLENNLLVTTERNEPVLMTFRGCCTHFDAMNPQAQKYVWEKIKENYYKYGIKMFWLDEAEPEMKTYDYDNVRYFLGNGLEVSNIYPFFYAKAFYEGMKNESEEEIVNLIRCAWHGVQRFGTVVWSGDIPSTFESLRNQIKAGLHMSMCGIPWWTTDIGGFYGGDPDDPRFRELIVRWFQFGVFSPIFRLHGNRIYKRELPNPNDPDDPMNLVGGPNEIWSYGQEAYEIIKELLFLREKMKPYIIKHMKKAHETGVPMMRPLFFDFPTDNETYEIGDQYMFGPDILVAPVVYESEIERTVYLPKGAKWKECESEEEYEGGQWIEVQAPLNKIPVFTKNGIKVF